MLGNSFFVACLLQFVAVGFSCIIFASFLYAISVTFISKCLGGGGTVSFDYYLLQLYIRWEEHVTLDYFSSHINTQITRYYQ